jgi:hypothetical protein
MPLPERSIHIGGELLKNEGTSLDTNLRLSVGSRKDTTAICHRVDPGFPFHTLSLDYTNGFSEEILESGAAVSGPVLLLREWVGQFNWGRSRSLRLFVRGRT